MHWKDAEKRWGREEQVAMVKTKLVAVEEPWASPGSALLPPSLRNKCTPATKVGRSPMRFEAMRCDALGSQRPAGKRAGCLFEILDRQVS